MNQILTKLIRTLGILLLLSVSALSWAGYKDGESGCRLVLCLANPNGPMSAEECVQDVQELYHQWEKGNPAPSSVFVKGVEKILRLRGQQILV